MNEDSTFELLKCNSYYDKHSGATVYFDEDGKPHREFGPAVVFDSGELRWYKHGLLHREDGPAIIIHGGSTQYWRDGNWYPFPSNYCESEL